MSVQKVKMTNIKLPLERGREVSEMIPASATQGDTLYNLAASNAVDKDLSTLAVIDADNGGGWLKLQFQGVHLIHKIKIFYKFYTGWYHGSIGWCEQTVDKFVECVDKDNNVDVSVYQGDEKQKSCGTLQLTYGLKQSDQIYTLICNAEGDTVKLSKNTGQIAVSEVVVMSTGI